MVEFNASNVDVAAVTLRPQKHESFPNNHANSIGDLNNLNTFNVIILIVWMFVANLKKILKTQCTFDRWTEGKPKQISKKMKMQKNLNID